MNIVEDRAESQKAEHVHNDILPAQRRRTIVAVLILIHSCLLAYSAQKNSWTWDEVAFLPAGISHWTFGDFELFDVNPPLIRMVAAVPVLFADPKLDWEGYTTNPTVRPERPIGEKFVQNNGQRSFWLLTMARWACIPFSLVGGIVCYHWSRKLFGDRSGLLALFLWTFSPTIIGNGQLITADVGGTSLGILGFYVFWRWLHDPSWKKTVLLGGVMGMMELAKTTWVIAFGVWPVMWLLWRWTGRSEGRRIWLIHEGRRLATAFAIAIYVLNLGYGFQGTGRRLGDFEFISTTIGGPVIPGTEDRGQLPMYPTSFRGTIRNRFSDTLLGQIPVPLPQKYVEGIDRQKSHFETKCRAYLGGEWKEGGWYYYYLYGLWVKTPHGTWLVMLTAAIGALSTRRLRGRTRDNLFLLGAILVLLTFVSLQTGINRHMRYVLPAFPFAFILASRAGALFAGTSRILSAPVAVGCVSLMFSSLSTFPHHLSYFNEMAGGPKNGMQHLASSNIDWGQDLLQLADWLREHPEVELDGLAWHCRVVDPRIVGIEATAVPTDPEPGWYALSVNRLPPCNDRYDYFRHLSPVAWAGYSIPIFHVTPDDAERLSAYRENSLPGSPLVSVIAQSELASGDGALFVAYSEFRQQLVTGTDRGSVYSQSLQNLSERNEISHHSGRARSGQYSSDGKTLIVGWSDGNVMLDTGADSKPIRIHANVGSLRAVDISADGGLFAIAGESGLVELRSTESPQVTMFQLDHRRPVLTLSFADSGNLLATGTGVIDSGVDGGAWLWNTTTGTLVRKLPNSNATVKAISTSSDGRFVAGRGDENLIWVWDVLTEHPATCLPDSQQIMFTQFSSDNRHLIGGDYHGYLKVWDLKTTELKLSKRAHEGMVSGGCRVGNTGRIATTGVDGKLRIWDATAIPGLAVPASAPSHIRHNATPELAYSSERSVP